MTVTVGIPYYFKTNKNELKAAIESILQQTRKPDMVHLIQDGPVPDELVEIVKYYLDKDNVIRHLSIPNRTGLPYALNYSIINSNTIYYARMDSDDISHPNRLERQLEYLIKYPNIDILGTWAMEFENDIHAPDNTIRKVPSDLNEIKKLFHYRNPLNHPSIVFRRDVFAKIGLYNPAFLKAQDTELYARALKKNIGIANIPEVLYYLRVTDVVNRRATSEHFKYQVIGRYKYNTWSIRLNVLKLLSIIFRLLPKSIQKICYKHYRW